MKSKNTGANAECDAESLIFRLEVIMRTGLCYQSLYLLWFCAVRGESMSLDRSEIPWVTLQYRQSSKWCRLNNSFLAFIGICLWGSSDAEKEQTEWTVCILCESKRSWRMSLLESKIKQEKRWREHNDREHRDGGPPPALCSYLWQAFTRWRFFQESWPTLFL